MTKAFESWKKQFLKLYSNHNSNPTVYIFESMNLFFKLFSDYEVFSTLFKSPELSQDHKKCFHSKATQSAKKDD